MRYREKRTGNRLANVMLSLDRIYWKHLWKIQTRQGVLWAQRLVEKTRKYLDDIEAHCNARETQLKKENKW